MNKKANTGIIIFLALITLIILVGIGYSLGYALTVGEETITIKEKWVKYSGDDAKYLISSEDGQVFQITDSILKWRFDSSNLYAYLEQGETYNIDTQGWRFGFLSSYKNIIRTTTA